MQKKLQVFKREIFVVALLLILVFAFFSANSNAQGDADYNLHENFSLFYRLSDVGCIEQQSEWFSASINDRGVWRSDANSNEIGCLELKLDLRPNEETNEDFRVCIQTAETLTENGGNQTVTGEGEAQCTGFALQAGGSAIAGTANGSAAGALRIWLETKEPAALDKVITDFRFSAAIGNYNPEEWGATNWTSKISQLSESSPSSVSSPAYLDGEKIVLARLNLESLVNDVDVVRRLKEDQGYIAPDTSNRVNLTPIRFIDRDGFISCPQGTILQATIGQDKRDNSIWHGICYDAPNLFEEGVDDVVVKINSLGPASDHQYRKGFYCPDNYAIVGFEHRGIDDGRYRGTSHSGDETELSLICRKLKEGVIDYGSDELWVHGPNGPSGCVGDTCFTTADGSGGFNDDWNAFYAWNVDPTNMYVYTGVGYNYFDDMHVREYFNRRILPQYEWVAPPPGVCPEGEPNCPNPVPPGPECDNYGYDDDGDGLADFGEDPDCPNPEHNDEGEGEPLPPEADECSDGLDNDHDGYIDSDDPGCANGQERDNISCGFSADPNVVAVGIGTSELSWNCLHSDGTTKIHPSLRVTVEPDSNEIFPGLAGEESREDTANVSPERPVTNFFLRIFGVNFADSDPRKGEPIHTESAEVRTSTTTFDEVIP